MPVIEPLLDLIHQSDLQLCGAQIMQIIACSAVYIPICRCVYTGFMYVG